MQALKTLMLNLNGSVVDEDPDEDYTEGTISENDAEVTLGCKITVRNEEELLIMTADYALELKIYGDGTQLKKMLGIVGQYSNNGGKPAYFGGIEVDGQDVDFSNISDEIVANGNLTVTATGPWGRYGELNDVCLFRDLADC